MKQHTPGPWRVYQGNFVHPSFDGPGPQTTNNDFAICETFGPDRYANAHICAAGPEMLDALRAVTKKLDEVTDMQSVIDAMSIDEIATLTEILAASRKAIRKAEGKR